jgi:hypothetical protein
VGGEMRLSFRNVMARNYITFCDLCMYVIEIITGQKVVRNLCFEAA